MTFFYAVHKGKIPGIYSSWPACKKQIDKYDGAIFKKFTDENNAKLFVKDGFGENKKPRIITRRENDDKKNSSKIQDEEEDDSIDKIFIYTDGSCIKLKTGSKAGYGIYIPDKNIKVSKPLLNQKITNNRAELSAIIESVDYLDETDLHKKICIFTDSQYCMYLFNGTGERYEKDNYKKDGKDVPNIDLIKKLLIIKNKYNIVLLKVRAHTDKKDKHTIGNKIADKLANDGASANSASANSASAIGASANSSSANSASANSASAIGASAKGGSLFFEQGNDTEDNVFYNKKQTKIKSQIKINELFEFDESSNIEESNSYSINTNEKKHKKNPVLTNWFIKI